MATNVRDRDEGLLERGGELGAVDHALETAAAGDGMLLALAGPAGIGKTRLLEAARARAEERGMRVLSARGGDVERDFAYGVVRQLLERAVARAAPKQRAALLDGAAAHASAALGLEAPEAERATEDQSFVVRHGLYWLVSNIAAHQPLVLVVDDVHWADAPSLRFLAYLSRRLDGLAALVVVAVRTGDPSTDEALLGELLGDPAVRHVTPRPLSLESTVRLIGDRTGAQVEEPFAAACHEATGGNPFLVNELAAALAADAIAPVGSNAARVSALGPQTVARSVLLRLGRVSPESVAFARAVAVLSATADPRLAATLAGLSQADARTALDALAAAGVLAPERPLRFAHPILREAVYRDLPPARRDALHADAARALADADAPASEVAAHLLATPPGADPAVVTALRLAAREALGQGAADLAARYLRRALAERPPGDSERPPLLGDLGRAEWLAGEDPMAAVEHLREALAATTGAPERTDLAVALARATFSVGDIAGAADAIYAEIDRTPADAVDCVLRLEAELGSIVMLSGATPEIGKRIERFSDLPGDTLPQLLVLANVAVWHYMVGTAQDAVEYARRALGGGRAVEGAGADSIAVLQAIWTLSYGDEHKLAEHALDATLADARRTGSIFGLTASHTMRALVAYRHGDIVRAEAEARTGMDLPGLPPFVHTALHTYLALALIERGELDEADSVMEASWVGPYLPSLAHMTPAFYALGLLRLAQGRPADARDAFLELGSREEQMNLLNPGISWRAGAVRALMALGDDGEAQRLAEEGVVHAERWGTAAAIGVARHARAIARGALDELETAVGLLSGSPARLDHAKALVDLGVMCRVDGRKTAAREMLREALDCARACGATMLAHRAHDELITAGARPRRLQFSGVESLTPSERRVCDLAASGATNRQIAQELFVTIRTVENHLGRAYSKLGIGSRDELAGALEG